MAIIWDTKNNAGGFSGYTNGAWSSFMQTYAFSLIPQSGFDQSGQWFYANYSVYFPYPGTYTVTAAVDNLGVLTVAGNSCAIANYYSSATTSFYASPGTYTISLGMYNIPLTNTDQYSVNPMGMAVTIDAPPPPPPPSINSFSLSSTQICRGGTSSLSWSVSGDVNSVSINQGIGNVASSSPTPYTVNPISTTTYTLTATGSGGTTTRSVILTVKQPTSTSITSNPAPIINGQCTTLTWVTTGDATSASITPGIGSVNINGTRRVCPTETTTYEIIVTGVCTNSSDFVTVTVYQPPTVTISGPVSLNYGQLGILTYEATNVNISLQVFPTYSYKNQTVSGNTISLSLGEMVSGEINIGIPYNDFGPTSVSYLIVATGNGGQESKQIIIPIIIDETPQNLLIPESVDLFKSQEPIYSPDSTITSYKIIINDIDIPIEIKANKPILVDINDNDQWNNLRQI